MAAATVAGQAGAAWVKSERGAKTAAAQEVSACGNRSWCAPGDVLCAGASDRYGPIIVCAVKVVGDGRGRGRPPRTHPEIRPTEGAVVAAAAQISAISIPTCSVIILAAGKDTHGVLRARL